MRPGGERGRATFLGVRSLVMIVGRDGEKQFDKGRALIRADEKGSVLRMRLCASELFSEGTLTGRVASTTVFCVPDSRFQWSNQEGGSPAFSRIGVGPA